MKKVSLILLSLILTWGAYAQSHSHNGIVNTQLGQGAPNGTLYQFRSMGHAEMFVVYIDGVPYNDQPSQRVFLNNIEPMEHDVAVRLVSPCDRLLSFTIDFAQPGMTYLLEYDPSTGVFSMNAPGSNMAFPATAPYYHQHAATTYPGYTHDSHNSSHPHGDVHHNDMQHAVDYHGRPDHHATDMEVGDLVNVMYKTSFDSDRLSVAKTFVKSKWICSAQAIRIARSITFDDGRLEFLLFAFDYCVDSENYYLTSETLTFNSNRKKLMRHIQAH